MTHTSDNWLLVEDRDWLLKVVLRRPDRLNAIVPEVLDRIYEETLRFENEARYRVLLITAEGAYFSSGMDLSRPAPEFSGSTLEARRYYRHNGVQRLGDLFESIEKPVVVAHQGPCLGGALEFSLCCDFRLASDCAAYGLPEIRIGVIPGSGGVSRLTRIAGPHWTRWLAMAGETIDAQRALAIGLVHDVFPAEEFEERVYAFCEKLNGLPPEALGVSKLTIDLAADLERAQARNVERMANSILFVGPELTARRTNFLNRKGSKSG
jgi:enoyl-CoA hydratase/carnithine racemase